MADEEENGYLRHTRYTSHITPNINTSAPEAIAEFRHVLSYQGVRLVHDDRSDPSTILFELRGM